MRRPVAEPVPAVRDGESSIYLRRRSFRPTPVHHQEHRIHADIARPGRFRHHVGIHGRLPPPDPASTGRLRVGSTAFAMTAMFLAAAGYATFATGVLPRWTGWVAYIGAGLCVACVPAMYFGPVDYSSFYNAGGWGPAIIANFPPAIWFLIVSILMIRKWEAVALK